MYNILVVLLFTLFVSSCDLLKSKTNNTKQDKVISATNNLADDSSSGSGTGTNSGSNSNGIVDLSGYPTLSLNGSSQVAIPLGAAYNEYGAEAYDSKDGDLTNNIIIKNKVNTSQVGLYNLNYSITDSDGNLSDRTQRIVKVYSLPEDLSNIDLAKNFSTVSQGSSYLDYLSFFVVDGDPKTFNHTLNDDGNWIQIKVPDEVYVNSIKITNRNGMITSIKDASLYISEEPYSPSISIDDRIRVLDGVKGTQTITVDPYELTGKYVILKAKNGVSLYVAGIEVYGEYGREPVGRDIANLYGFATQGSKYNGDGHSNYAFNAIDGDNETLNHTMDNSANWLQVELPANAKINTIKVLNREGYNKFRLEGAKVYVSNSPYSGDLSNAVLVKTLKGIDTYQTKYFSTNVGYKYVFVKAAEGQFLHLRSLEVYGTATPKFIGDDIAKVYGQAIQGSTYQNESSNAAVNAIDGDVTTLQKTNSDSTNWLEIDLPSNAKISGILVKNSLEGDKEMLEGAEVYVSNSPYADGLSNAQLVGFLKGVEDSQMIYFNSKLSYKYVFIKGAVGKYLHVRSVKIYGAASQSLFGDDIAHLYGSAIQGSTHNNIPEYFAASKVIDGDVDTYNYTTDNVADNWLEISLPEGFQINGILIVNRNTKISRLRGAKVYLSNSPYSAGLLDARLVKILKGIAANQKIYFNTDLKYKYVIIKGDEDDSVGADKNNLHISSVEIYGTETSE